MTRSKASAKRPSRGRAPGGKAGAAARVAAERATAAVERRATWATWLMTGSVLAWVPGGFSRFVVAKLLVSAVACAIGFTVPSRRRLPRQVVLLLGAGIAIFTVAALTGGTPVASLVGRWPRYEGLPVLLAYGACAWLGARLLDSPRRWATLTTAVAAMACVLGVFSVLDAAGWSPLGVSDEARDGSLLGNATDQGLVGMLALAVLARPAYDTLRELYLFASAGAALTVVLSGSRAALGASILILVALALRERRRLLAPAAGAIAALIVVVVAVPFTRERLTSVHSIRGRWLEWEMAGRAFLDYPLLGIGPSRFVDVVGGYENQAWVDWSGGGALDSPHSWPLQVLLAGGLPLVACALALCVLFVRSGLRASAADPAMMGACYGVIGYGVAMTVNFTNPTSTCLAAFLAGAVIGAPAPADAAPEQRRIPLLASGAAALATVVLLVACASEILLQRGITRSAQGDGSATATLQRATSLRPGDADARMIAAQALAGLASDGRHPAVAADAASLARASLARTPGTYDARVALGVAELGRGRPEQAIASLSRAVDAFPYRPVAYVQRALARLAVDDLRGAKADLRRARDLGDRQARQLLRQVRSAEQRPPRAAVRVTGSRS